MKTACERDDRSFILVAAVARALLPSLISRSISVWLVTCDDGGCEWAIWWVKGGKHLLCVGESGGVCLDFRQILNVDAALYVLPDLESLVARREEVADHLQSRVQAAGTASWHKKGSWRPHLIV